MEDAVKKTLLTSMTDETDDDILSAALLNAESIILTRLYPFGNIEEMVMPSRYDSLSVRIGAYFLNKRGAEGQVQHNENNVYRYYESGDVPNSMLDEITPFGSSIR